MQRVRRPGNKTREVKAKQSGLVAWSTNAFTFLRNVWNTLSEKKNITLKVTDLKKNELRIP